MRQIGYEAQTTKFATNKFLATPDTFQASGPKTCSRSRTQEPQPPPTATRGSIQVFVVRVCPFASCFDAQCRCRTSANAARPLHDAQPEGVQSSQL